MVTDVYAILVLHLVTTISCYQVFNVPPSYAPQEQLQYPINDFEPTSQFQQEISTPSEYLRAPLLLQNTQETLPPENNLLQYGLPPRFEQLPLTNEQKPNLLEPLYPPMPPHFLPEVVMPANQIFNNPVQLNQHQQIDPGGLQYLNAIYNPYNTELVNGKKPVHHLSSNYLHQNNYHGPHNKNVKPVYYENYNAPKKYYTQMQSEHYGDPHANSALYPRKHKYNANYLNPINEPAFPMPMHYHGHNKKPLEFQKYQADTGAMMNPIYYTPNFPTKMKKIKIPELKNKGNLDMKMHPNRFGNYRNKAHPMLMQDNQKKLPYSMNVNHQHHTEVNAQKPMHPHRYHPRFQEHDSSEDHPVKLVSTNKPRKHHYPDNSKRRPPLRNNKHNTDESDHKLPLRNQNKDSIEASDDDESIKQHEDLPDSEEPDYDDSEDESPESDRDNGSTGPVHTFVKTDKNANYKWGVRLQLNN